jgi:aminoglycoside 3-N-acetyltransferase
MTREYSIRELFADLGISPGDVIMIHGDAGIAAQLTHLEVNRRLDFLIEELVSFIGAEGTLVVPAFSYSFTKNEDFFVQTTPSDVGLFSETFRHFPGVKRSKNPNFSVCSIGKHSEQFSGSQVDDCFGPDTAFDFLHQHNAKLVCLGCDFSRVTFVHYVEQKLGVCYRYLKSFSGAVIDGDQVQSITNTYYVRDLSIDSLGELSAVKQRALEKSVLSVKKYGRSTVSSITAKDFYAVAEELLVENPYALTQHRLNVE